jgi:hypothetical protein
MIRVSYTIHLYGEESLAYKTFKNLKYAFIFCKQVNGKVEVMK